jgi:hypothetical protein
MCDVTISISNANINQYAFLTPPPTRLTTCKKMAKERNTPPFSTSLPSFGDRDSN